MVMMGDPFNSYVFSTYAETEHIMSFFSTENDKDYLGMLLR